jgi:hypothetical protein
MLLASDADPGTPDSTGPGFASTCRVLIHDHDTSIYQASQLSISHGTGRPKFQYVRGAPRLDPQSRRELSLIVLEFRRVVSANVSEANKSLQHTPTPARVLDGRERKQHEIETGASNSLLSTLLLWGHQQEI